jgi:hypothetical protein
MLRRASVAGILAAFGAVALLTWSWAAPAPPPAASVVDKLNKTADFKGFDDPKTTLSEALEHLTKLYGVDFEVNERAFKFEQLMDVEKSEIAQPGIRPMKEVRLERLLKKVLSRIAVPSGATFLVRRDCIEITTNQFVDTEVWGRGGSNKDPHLPLVNLTIRHRPLNEVLHQLAEDADFNILVDNRAKEESQTEVTAQLRNAPLDSAVRLLADQAGLRAVHLDNMLYVTTQTNAAALDARLNKDFPVAPDSGEDGGRPRKGGSRNIIPQGAGGA